MRARILPLLCVIAVASPAGAQESPDDDAPRLRLSIEGANARVPCIHAEALTDAVAARLGYDPFDPAAPVEMRVTLAETPSIEIALFDAAGVLLGRRTIVRRGRSCRSHLEDVALAAALAIEPLASRAEDPEPPPPPLPPQPPPIAAPPPTPEPEEPTPPAAEVAPAPSGEPFAFSLELAPAFVYGSEPEPSFAGVLAARGRVSLVSFSLGARVDAPASRAVGPARVESFLALGLADVCVHLEWFGACALAAVGALRAEGVGLENAQRVSSEYAAIGGSVLARIDLGSGWAIVPRVDGLATLTRIALVVDDLPAWVTPPGSLAARVSVEWTITTSAPPVEAAVGEEDVHEDEDADEDEGEHDDEHARDERASRQRRATRALFVRT